MKHQLRLPFYLTYKYLQRGRKWTLALTLFLMAVAFVNLLFVSSLFNGIMVGTNQQIIDTMTGNVYMTPATGDQFIYDAASVLDEIRSIPGVDAASTETQVPGRLEFNQITGNWQILAIDPKDEAEALTFPEKIISGSYLDASDENGILIGNQIAGGPDVEENAFSFRGAQVGDKVNLTLDEQTYQFTVRGIFKTKFINADERAFITRAALQKILPNIDGDASTIVIKTDSTAMESEVIESIRDRNLAGQIYSWREVAGLMKSVSESFTSINVLMTTVGILIAAVTIFIVIYVDIVNKRKQIGILRAIGIKPYIIIFSYVILSAVYSVLGVLLGTALFYFALVPYFNAHPFVLPIVDAVLVLDKVDYIARAEAVMWVAVFSGLIPAVLVTRGKMIDAIAGR